MVVCLVIVCSHPPVSDKMFFCMCVYTTERQAISLPSLVFGSLVIYSSERQTVYYVQEHDGLRERWNVWQTRCFIAWLFIPL